MNVNAKKHSKHVFDKPELERKASDKREMKRIANSCYAFIAQTDLMPSIGKTWGIVLGPRGKMPQPAPPNADITNIIERVKNTVRIRSKKNPTVQVPAGMEDMTPEDLAQYGSYFNSNEDMIRDQIPGLDVSNQVWRVEQYAKREWGNTQALFLSGPGPDNRPQGSGPRSIPPLYCIAI